MVHYVYAEISELVSCVNIFQLRFHAVGHNLNLNPSLLRRFQQLVVTKKLLFDVKGLNDHTDEKIKEEHGNDDDEDDEDNNHVWCNVALRLQINAFSIR